MATGLIFASFLSTIGGLYLKESQFRLAFIKACIIHSCLIVFSTEFLSLSRSLDFTHIASLWLIISLANCSVFWNRYRRLSNSRNFEFNFKSLDRASQLSILFTITIVLISLLTALIAPPNNWDSMTYHNTPDKI